MLIIMLKRRLKNPIIRVLNLLNYLVNEWRIRSGLRPDYRIAVDIKTDFIENGCKREKTKMKRNIKLIGNTISK